VIAANINSSRKGAWPCRKENRDVAPFLVHITQPLARPCRAREFAVDADILLITRNQGFLPLVMEFFHERVNLRVPTAHMTVSIDNF
jgi:hypothetical protein